MVNNKKVKISVYMVHVLTFLPVCNLSSSFTGHGRGIHDLNKSLAVDPALFQAFLAQAAHYGRTGRYSKAILNCNEAIRIVPNSVWAYVYRYDI